MARNHTHSVIQRKNQNTKKIQKILLYVEGRNTEPSYFDLLKRSNCTQIPVTVRGHGIGACVDFVNEAAGKYNSLPAKEKAKYIIDHGFPVIDNFYSDSLADTPLALCAEKAHLVTKKATTVVDWPDLDSETMKKVKKKIDTGWDIHLKED